MSALRVLHASPRSLSILIAPTGATYHLPKPVMWSLHDEDGQEVTAGQTEIAALFLHDLEPECSYHLRTHLGDLSLKTTPCSGCINPLDFGVDVGAPNNADAFARAIDAVPKGGTLRLPPGHYLTGPIFLNSHMTLQLDTGATLAAIADRTDWPHLPERDTKGQVLGSWEGVPARCYAAVVTAIDCAGLTLTGGGVVDGGGHQGDWWDWPKETRDGARRPRTVHIIRGDDIAMTGITVRNAPSWTIHPYRCRNLHVSNITVENPADSPNTDALNPESCERVEIIGSRFSVGDDCIAIKAGKRAPGAVDHLALTCNVAISHCLMERGHGAVVLGSEMSGGIRDVTLTDCHFHATDRGLRLKTRRGRGGEISGIRMKRVQMTDVPTPFAVNAFYYCDPDGKADWVQSRNPAIRDETTPQIFDISLEDITAEGVAQAAVAILGLPEAPITDIRIINYRAAFDPNAKAAVPLMALGVPTMRHEAIFAEFATIDGEVLPLIPVQEPEPC